MGRLTPLQISLQQSIDELEHAFGAPAECHSPSDQTQIHSNDPICASGSAQSSPHAAGSRASGRNIILLDGDCLESTTEHRAWVGTGLALMAALFTAGASQVHDVPSAAGSAAAVVSAFLTADLLSGVYHWGVDNYGDGQTSVFGSQIAGFQAHHQRPWTITERQFANNVHKVFKPAVPFVAACLLVSPVLPPWISVWLSTATFFTVMSQQFHAWSHMKASQLPSAVIALQNAGLLVSRKAHGAHHRAPFEGNYCIVSGIWNDLLDQDGGERGTFRRLERLVHSVTGVEPRCWSEPQYDWEAYDTAELENIREV